MVIKMRKLDPSKATETSLDRTDEDGERLLQRRTTRKQWQRNAFTKFTSVLRNPKELARELMTGDRRRCISKFPIQRNGETPDSSECLGASSRHTSGQRESLDLAALFEAVQYIHQTVGTKRGAEVHPSFRQQRELMRFTSGTPDPVAVAC